MDVCVCVCVCVSKYFLRPDNFSKTKSKQKRRAVKKIKKIRATNTSSSGLPPFHFHHPPTPTSASACLTEARSKNLRSSSANFGTVRPIPSRRARRQWWVPSDQG